VPDRPVFSVIVPTCGRKSLDRAIKRLRQQDEGDIEVIVIGDGYQPGAERIVRRAGRRWPGIRYYETEPTYSWGNSQRMLGMERAEGRYLLFLDDDDLTARGAFASMRAAVHEHPGSPLIFRMRRDKGIIWTDRELRIANVSTQLFLVPNTPAKLGSWLTRDRRESDLDFIQECVERQGGPIWRHEIIALQNAPPRWRVLIRAHIVARLKRLHPGTIGRRRLHG
jgi:glycosyltransferase involved in cell wall biosynthesis